MMGVVQMPNFEEFFRAAKECFGGWNVGELQDQGGTRLKRASCWRGLLGMIA